MMVPTFSFLISHQQTQSSTPPRILLPVHHNPSVFAPTTTFLRLVTVNYLQIAKMGDIVVINHSTVEIKVRVTAAGSGDDKGYGSENWYSLEANGGTDTWSYREQPQIVFYVKSDSPGSVVSSVFGVPGQTVDLY
ncbi:hypothetical protein NPX13_g8600 [Xylaria arbuscula]|uniref:Uncharacterized protein n=1 Tax=Xylaria arbuscula TaxID=114810 RepID=A0A9W8TI78_9PEZI|nr:hypothetical protein NPX13_g8600 [Xylaria arbuscula]